MKKQNTEEHVAKKETFPRIPQVDKKWQSMEMVVTGRERKATYCILYNMCMYCEWEATYLSPIDKIPDNPTCPHKRRKARYLLEKSYKTIKQSADKPMTISWYILFQMNVK